MAYLWISEYFFFGYSIPLGHYGFSLKRKIWELISNLVYACVTQTDIVYDYNSLRMNYEIMTFTV